MKLKKSGLASLRSGFTLIELLIVVSIIALLSIIGLVSYTTFLKNTRDAKRQSDLKQIQSALEQYRADQFFYPTAIVFGAPLTNTTGNPSSPAVTRTYLNVVPSDSALPQYCYNPLSGTGSYELYAKLDNPPSGSTNLTCAGNSGYYLKVTPP